MLHRFRSLFFTLLFVLLSSASSLHANAQQVEHVFIISMDGGKPSVMRQSAMPILFALAQNGAVTWNAQAVLPSVTLVNHASMVTGVGPKKHRVTWNDWKPEKGLVPVPTIFSIAKKQGYKTAMFAGKTKFRHLNRPGSLDRFAHPGYTAKKIASEAAQYIAIHKPHLSLIHFPDPDSAGHLYGWGSPQQKLAFARTDDALKTILNAIHQAGIQSRSVVIVTADHGGRGRRHGSASPEDRDIPWVAWGAGVRPNHRITRPVSTTDTAATALWLLDIPRPPSFDGKPVTHAFQAQF
ncbi:MAG: alkaline phosphatase family protein [Armatimonadetes bacterium]|nr:alkaline phosphatase family protein [Armatimonadota bacterium]